MMGRILYRLYGVENLMLRYLVLWLVLKSERGALYSATLRRIFARYHGIQVGRYSYGGCFDAKRVGAGTTFGSYCSVARPIYIFNRNHPYDHKSQHPFFFNKALGIIAEEKLERKDLVIGNDVWIGCNAVILPGVSSIGDGAVIGASAVVTKDVPPFAIVGGNPARIIKYRFSPEKIAEIIASKWWEKSIDELKQDIRSFTGPVE